MDFALPSNWRDDIINRFENKSLAQRLGIRTKWLVVNAR